MIAKEEALKKLDAFFDSIYLDKEATEKCYAKMESKNMNRGRFNSFVCNMVDLSSMTDEEVFWFAKSCPEAEIKIEDHFSEQERKQYSKSKEKKKRASLPITFNDVLQIDQDQYVTTITTKELYDLYNGGLLVYNTSTQRAPKISYKNGKLKYKVNINKHSVNEIRNLIERNLFIPNDITFNIRQEDPVDYYYSPENATLKLRLGILDILDGFHRIMALIQVLNADPDYEKIFVLNLMCFTEDKAKRYIAQQDKKNKISQSYSKSLDDTRFENIITNRINESSDSVLFGQIKSVGRRSIDFARTSDAIRTIFKPKNMGDVTTVSKKIITGFQIVFSFSDIQKLNDTDIKVALVYICVADGKENEKQFQKLQTYFEDYPDELKSIVVMKRSAEKLITKDK